MQHSKLKLKQLAAAYPTQLQWADGSDAGRHRILLAAGTLLATGIRARSAGHATARAPIHPRGAATPPASPPRTQWVPACASNSRPTCRMLCKWEKGAHSIDGCWARNRGGDCPYVHHDQPDLLKIIACDAGNPDRSDADVMWNTAAVKIAASAVFLT